MGSIKKSNETILDRALRDSENESFIHVRVALSEIPERYIDEVRDILDTFTESLCVVMESLSFEEVRDEQVDDC
jgi:hypothetical protein